MPCLSNHAFARHLEIFIHGNWQEVFAIIVDLAVIILNWNAAEDTICCIRRLSTWENLRVAIWVVDNASTGDSAQQVAQQYPNASLLRNATNLGFAGGTNRGITAALAVGNQPILLLNNDAFMDEEAADRLLQTLRQDETIGLVAPLLFEAGQGGKLLSAGGKNPVKHHQTRVLNVPKGPLFNVESVSGTAVLIRAAVLREVGLLDERFFFSTELADLCWRARRSGYRIVVDVRARAFHDVGRSSPLRETLYAYYIVRNRFLFLRNHYRRHLELYSFWTLYTLALWLKLLWAGQRQSACAIRLGLADGLRGRFGGQNERVLAACATLAS